MQWITFQQVCYSQILAPTHIQLQTKQCCQTDWISSNSVGLESHNFWELHLWNVGLLSLFVGALYCQPELSHCASLSTQHVRLLCFGILRNAKRESANGYFAKSGREMNVRNLVISETETAKRPTTWTKSELERDAQHISGKAAT